jgi:FMN phosphatase YigB (HAD superfamily)
MGHQITGVLFDVGGVLAALDGVPSLAALLGVRAEQDAIHATWMASPAVVAHETGKIGPAEFAVGAVADLKLPVTPECFLEDFRRWLQGPLPGAAELLAEIPRNYGVSALSNMSALHWDAIAATGLTQRFDQVFVSHRIGHLKPASEAFEIALDGMQRRPAEPRQRARRRQGGARDVRGYTVQEQRLTTDHREVVGACRCYPSPRQGGAECLAITT